MYAGEGREHVMTPSTTVHFIQHPAVVRQARNDQSDEGKKDRFASVSQVLEYRSSFSNIYVSVENNGCNFSEKKRSFRKIAALLR